MLKLLQQFDFFLDMYSNLQPDDENIITQVLAEDDDEGDNAVVSYNLVRAEWVNTGTNQRRDASVRDVVLVCEWL